MRLMLFFDGRYPRYAFPVLAEYIRPNVYPRKSNSPSGTLQICVFSSLTTASGTRLGNTISATGNATTSTLATTNASRRFCTVNIVMTEGQVSRVNYAGPTGGLLTGGEQCALAV